MKGFLNFVSSMSFTACALMVGVGLLTGSASAFPTSNIKVIDCNSASCDATCTTGTGACAAPCTACHCSGANGVYFCTD